LKMGFATHSADAGRIDNTKLAREQSRRHLAHGGVQQPPMSARPMMVTSWPSTF
jgi:hypothetical protein